MRRVEQGSVGYWWLHIEGSCDAGQEGVEDRSGSCDAVVSYVRLKKKNQWSVVKNCYGNTQQGPVFVS